jgi:predicted nuclease of predicted toxin-antitoxin system
VRITLDENLGRTAAALLRDAGHDAATVLDQGLASAADRALIAACHTEARCLVTLDVEFSNPFLFPPAE